MPEAPKPSPERGETDSSLRTERERADQELAKRVAAVESDADEVLDSERERADSLLEATRQQADGNRDAVTAVAEARASEDEAVVEERVAVDEALEAERAAQKRALFQLLALEREETDDRLLTERARSDTAVASRDDFLAIVSHDVRGILAGMASGTELIARLPLEGEVGERAHREAARLRRLTGQMNRLVGDLLDVVGMESGKLSVVVERQDAVVLVAEAVERFRQPVATLGVTLAAEVPDGEVLASFDHDRLLQVLTNLVGNALKFTERGGHVMVRLAREEGRIQFTVRDDGCGIAEEHLEAIFERFSQLAQNDRRGLGLGLYITRSIVLAHGGVIWAESAPGRGSAFHFTLPDLAVA